MNYFENEEVENDIFDNLETLLFDEEKENEISCGDARQYSDSCLEVLESLPNSTLLSGIKEMFEENLMNEHLVTVDLLGDLGYSDILMYYCLVMDLTYIGKDLNDEEVKKAVVTPEEYLKINDENVDKKEASIDISYNETSISKLKEVISYIKNREFTILSNTFYSDGSDFVVFIIMKSSVGYNLRLKITIKCKDCDSAKQLEREFGELGNKTGDNNI